NGIWFRIVRNFFWSAVAGEFDVVVGNPPWVRWSNLPEMYRERIKPTCEQYAIFSATPFHGGNRGSIPLGRTKQFSCKINWLRRVVWKIFRFYATRFLRHWHFKSLHFLDRGPLYEPVGVGHSSIKLAQSFQ